MLKLHIVPAGAWDPREQINQPCAIITGDLEDIRQLDELLSASMRCGWPMDEVVIKKAEFVVVLETGVWLAHWSGDPGRTTDLNNAKRFGSRVLADEALVAARTWRSFLRATIGTAP